MNLKTYGIVLLLSIWAHPAFSLTVLSDIDDTLKISNVLNPIDAATRVLSKTAFTGMPETFRGIAAQFIYLSARPEALASPTSKFLSTNQFPTGETIYRQNSDPKDPLRYKIERIRQLFLRTTGPFIMVGDDTQADPEAYATVAAEFSDRVLGIYIRQITGRALPRTAIPYLTAYDLASDWAHHAFISSVSSNEVTQSILNEQRFNHILPDFQTCPVTYKPENEAIQRLILTGCSRR